MSILNDRQIRELCLPQKETHENLDNTNLSDNFKPMIDDFYPQQVREVDGKKIISYGLSSFGYDVRLGNKFKIFTNVNSTVIDPLDFDHNSYVDYEGEFCIIPPNSYVLGVTMESFNIPRDIMVLCVGKSTLARAGVAVNVTPIESGMVGTIVLELANMTPLPVKVYAGHGVAQFLFLQGSEECEVSYADRAGKYMNQVGIVTPRL